MRFHYSTIRLSDPRLLREVPLPLILRPLELTVITRNDDVSLPEDLSQRDRRLAKGQLTGARDLTPSKVPSADALKVPERHLVQKGRSVGGLLAHGPMLGNPTS